MIEAGANEVPDEKDLEAIEKGHEVIKELCVFFKEIIAEIGKPKFTYESATIPAEIMTKVSEMAENVRNSILSADKAVRESAIDEITEEVTAALVEIDEWNLCWRSDGFGAKVVRDYLYNEHRRVDGRDIDEIRPLSARLILYL